MRVYPVCSSRADTGTYGIFSDSGAAVAMGEVWSGTDFNTLQWLAIIHAAALDDVSDICTNSSFVFDAINKWSPAWERNGYKNKEGKDVAHKDLIIIAKKLLEDKTVSFSNVRSLNRQHFISVTKHAGESESKTLDLSIAVRDILSTKKVEKDEVSVEKKHKRKVKK